MGSESYSQGTTGTIERNGHGTVQPDLDEPVLRTEDEGVSDEATELSKDVIFEVLKNSRRRQIIRYLLRAGRTVTTSELAEHIAAIENGIDIKQLDSKQRKRVYVALYQTHLPRLDKEDIIEYDNNRGRITLSKNAATVRPYLDDGYAIYETELWYFAACLAGGGLVFLLSILAQKTALIRLGVVLAFTFVVSLLVPNRDRLDWETVRQRFR